MATSTLAKQSSGGGGGGSGSGDDSGLHNTPQILGVVCVLGEFRGN